MPQKPKSLAQKPIFCPKSQFFRQKPKKSGLTIANYGPMANAYVRFRVEIVYIPEEANWIQVQAGADQVIMGDSIVIHESNSDRETLEIILIAAGVAVLIIIGIIISALRYSKRHAGNNQA